MLDAHSVQLDDIIARLNVLTGVLPPDQLPPPRPAVVIPPVVVNTVPAAAAPQVAPQPVAAPQPIAPQPVAAPQPQPVAQQPIAEPQPVITPQPVAEPQPAVAPQPVAEPQPVVAPQSAAVVYTAPDMQEPVAAPVSQEPAPQEPAPMPSQNAAPSVVEPPSANPVDDEEARLTTANVLLSMSQQDNFEYNDDVTPETDLSIPQTPFLAATSSARDNVSEEAESLGKGLREPTAEELQKLREHPFVKQVNDLFATDVIFARVKKNQ